MLLTCERLEPHSAPATVFALSFAADPWFTPQRESVIASAFEQWGAVMADPLPAITGRTYGVYRQDGVKLADSPIIPPDTYRVWVGVGPLAGSTTLAEAGPVNWSAIGGPLPRSPGGTVTFDPAKTTDVTLPAVALHEAGHTFGLQHTADGVMAPYLDPAHDHLTGLDLRNLLWSGHEILKGTVLTGIGTTPGGWAIYQG